MGRGSGADDVGGAPWRRVCALLRSWPSRLPDRIAGGLGDDADAIHRGRGVGPCLFDIGERHGAGADPEAALADLRPISRPFS